MSPVHFCRSAFQGHLLFDILLVAYMATAPSNDGFFCNSDLLRSMKSQNIWAIIYYSAFRFAIHVYLSIKRRMEGHTMSKSSFWRIWDSSAQTCSLVTALSMTFKMVFSSGGYISSYLPAMWRAVIPSAYRLFFWKFCHRMRVLSIMPTVT